MGKPGKYNKIKMIVSSIATGIGTILVLLKMYSHIGIILLSFGSVILALSLQARKKEVTSDELTEWIAGKSAVMAFWATYSTIVMLLAIDLYKPNFFEIWVSLGTVMIATVVALFFGLYYYGKVRKDIGF